MSLAWSRGPVGAALGRHVEEGPRWSLPVTIATSSPPATHAITDGGAADHDAHVRDLLLIALTFAAGSVDAVSYLGLGQIFTSNMTGNVVFLALAVGQANLLTALRSVDALIAFSLGAILAGRLLGPGRGGVLWPKRVTSVLSLQAVLLGSFAVGWAVLGGRPSGEPLYGLIGISAFAMGIQNAAARHLAVPGLTTTVVTTALTGVMAEAAALGISGTVQRRGAYAIVALFSGAAVAAALLWETRTVAPVVTVVTLVGVVAAAALVLGRAPSPSAVT